MESRGRYRTESYDQVVPRRRRRPCMQSGKPSCGMWMPTVPSWEKEFCLKVGLFPWKKFLEAKKYIHLSKNVMQWNDLAGEEAFHNAKHKFWAMLNGLPCNNISMTSPDIYIDEIDWNAETNPELLSGVELAWDEMEKEEEEEDEDEENHEHLQNKYSLVMSNLPIEPTGWDIVYTEEIAKTNILTGLIVGDH